MELSSESIIATKVALQAAAKLSTLKAWEHVSLANTAEGFAAMCCDGSMQVTARCERLAGADFNVIVPADRLAKILGAARGTVTASITDKSMTLRIAESRFTLPRYTEGEFPQYSDDKVKGSVTLPAQDLIDALGRVTPFAADKDIRYYLCGVILQQCEKGLNMVATDGFGIGVQRLTSATRGDNFAVIVPKGTCHKLHSLIGNAETVTLSVGDRLRVQAGETTIDAGLVNGQVVDWRRPLRAEHEGHAVVKAATAAAAFGEALLVHGSFKFRPVGAITFNSAGIDIKSRPDKDGGGYEGRLACVAPAPTYVQMDYMLDGLRDIFSLFPKDADVRVLYQGSQSALQFESDAVPGYMAVYTPMRA